MPFDTPYLFAAALAECIETTVDVQPFIGLFQSFQTFRSFNRKMVKRLMQKSEWKSALTGNETLCYEETKFAWRIMEEQNDRN